MKILITGATGLIGSELVKLLLAKGHAIHYLTTSKSKIENQPNNQGFYWNPQEGKIDENCIFGVEQQKIRMLILNFSDSFSFLFQVENKNS